MTAPGSYAVVVPSLGRPSLGALLRSLATSAAAAGGWAPDDVVVVDDRRGDVEVLAELPPIAGHPVRVVRSFGRGPAAARNLGWRTTRAPWVVFLDDDVLLPDDWSRRLRVDLQRCPPGVGGSQGRIEVPRPPGRRPTDWERSTAGLETARWATADMAYRRESLVATGGFDERFRRAYREDADLALRVRSAGWSLRLGERGIRHPVRPVDGRVSLRVQAGNADDALMRALHGRGWRAAAQVPRGRLPVHALTTGCALLTGVGLLTGARRTAWAAGAGALGLTADFAVRRIAPGPRPGEAGWALEWGRMLATSVAIPPAAVLYRVLGVWWYRRGAPPWPPPVRAVLFDRDGTLVHDEPYNGNPERVRPVAGAAAAVGRLRAAGVAVGVVSNQSGVGRGIVSGDQVRAVNAVVDTEIGPFDTWQVCLHTPEQGCACRKPAPGLVLRAATELGVRPEQCAVVGDIGADVQAALAAGARPVLVPTPVTRPEEVADAPVVTDSLGSAVDLLLSPPPPAVIMGSRHPVARSHDHREGAR